MVNNCSLSQTLLKLVSLFKEINFYKIKKLFLNLKTNTTSRNLVLILLNLITDPIEPLNEVMRCFFDTRNLREFLIFLLILINYEKIVIFVSQNLMTLRKY